MFLYAENIVIHYPDSQCRDGLPEENCAQGILASLEVKKM